MNLKGSAKYVPYLYNRVKDMVLALVNSQIIPDRDTVQISCDSTGSNEDFTNSTVNFKVFYGGADTTNYWTITVFSETNCETNLSTNSVSITAIAAEEASYTVRATRAGYITIDKVIQVSKVKDGADGADGASTPDGETIVLDGSTNLKVANHIVYDDGIEYSDTLLIGAGEITNTTSSVPSTNNILIQSDNVSTAQFSGCDNIINIGSGTTMTRGLSAGAIVNSNGMVIGHGLTGKVNNDIDNFADNFLINGIKRYGSENLITNNAISIGVDPQSKLSDALAISYPKEGSAYSINDNNELYHTSRVSAVGTGSSVDIDLDISDLGVQSAGVAKITMDINGYNGSTNTDVYTEQVHLILFNDTAVVDYSDANKMYSNGSMATLSVTHSYIAGGTLRVNVTTTTESGLFFIHYAINSMG